jgi:hypothetical protein
VLNRVYQPSGSASYGAAPNPNLLSSIRAAALNNVTTDSGESYVLFDNTSGVRAATILSLGMTIFTIVLFAGGSVLFTQDAERLFFKPIERMIKTIKRLATILFEMDGAGGFMGSSGKGEGDGGTAADDAVALDETILIEAVVGKISEIFNVKLERDGVKRKTTLMKTTNSRWRIQIEEEDIEPPPLSSEELSANVRNRDLLLIHEIEELASLSRCMESSICSMYLYQFARASYCVENLLFLNEVRNFRKGAEKISHHSRQIYSLFLAEDGINRIALHWDLRVAIGYNLNLQMAHLSDIFEEAERTLMDKLTRELYPRFLNSVYCLKLLKHLTLERLRAKKKRGGLAGRGDGTSPNDATNNSTGGHEVALPMSLLHDIEEEIPGRGRIGSDEMTQIRLAVAKQY